MKRLRKAVSALLLLLILLGSMVSCTPNEKNKIQSIEDIEYATIGVVTGSSWDVIVQKEFPNAERKYFTSPADMILSLEQGKIDTLLADNNVYAAIKWDNDTITCIDEPIHTFSNALIMAKDGYNEKLLGQINDFVAKCWENGTIAALTAKWFSEEEPQEHPDYTHLTGENGTLKIAAGDSMKPVSYIHGSLFSGYDIEFLTLFAEEYGYKLDFEGMTLDAMIPSVSTGKCDIGACGLTVTYERMESVTFTDPHFETYGVAVISSSSSEPDAQYNSIEDLEGKKIAVLTGTLWDVVAKNEIPNSDVKHFSTTTDLLLALDQGKVEGIVGPKTFYAAARWENVPVEIIDETETSIFSGFILSGENFDQKLLDQLNEFIDEANKDGTIDELKEKWLSDKEPTEHPDYHSLPGENGTLKVAVDNTAKPMIYRKNASFTGFDADLLTKFAEAYGYALEFEGMSFDALIPYVSSGKCDIGACGIAITPERAESATFTEPYIELEGVVMASRIASAAEESSFFDNIFDSFEKTFIREERWKLILEGIVITLIISICAVIGGTIFGLTLFMLSRSSTRLIRSITNGFTRVYSRIIAGTPAVVILMILFYVIFGNVRDINGILVAIVGFAFISGAFVQEHMAVSVSSVDQGQTEAAYALGYPKNKAFFRFVFPQAMKIFLPTYCGHVVELIKATAVVGYIAVNDLTKMGDIIRSNTYEAFFPLISTAIIYFLLTWLISLLLNLVKIHFEPGRRSKDVVLRGVKTK